MKRHWLHSNAASVSQTMENVSSNSSSPAKCVRFDDEDICAELDSTIEREIQELHRVNAEFAQHSASLDALDARSETGIDDRAVVLRQVVTSCNDPAIAYPTAAEHQRPYGTRVALSFSMYGGNACHAQSNGLVGCCFAAGVSPVYLDSHVSPAHMCV